MTVLRRMREHLGACREVDEGCDVGDGDERSPHDLDERCTRTPHARQEGAPYMPRQPGQCAAAAA